MLGIFHHINISTLIHSCCAGSIHRGWLKHEPLWVSQRQPQSQPWDPNDPSEASVGSNRKRPCHLVPVGWFFSHSERAFPLGMGMLAYDLVVDGLAPPNAIFGGSRTESIFQVLIMGTGICFRGFPSKLSQGCGCFMLDGSDWRGANTSPLMGCRRFRNSRVQQKLEGREVETDSTFFTFPSLDLKKFLAKKSKQQNPPS